MSALLVHFVPSAPSERTRRFHEMQTVADGLVDIARELAAGNGAGSEIVAWASGVRDSIGSHARHLETDDADLAQRLHALASVAEGVVHGVDFQFPFAPSRKLFSHRY